MRSSAAFWAASRAAFKDSSAWPERWTAALYAMPPAPTAMPATTRAVVLSCRAGGSGLLRSVKCGAALRLAARIRSEDMVAVQRVCVVHSGVPVPTKIRTAQR